MQEDFIVLPKSASVSVASGPVQNFLCSLMLLKKISDFPGLNNWLIGVHRSMTEEEVINNNIVIDGLFYAIITDREWSSVPEYLDHLKSLKPEVLVNRLFAGYANLFHHKKYEGNPADPNPPAIDIDSAMKSVDSYLEFIKGNFEQCNIDTEIESFSYEYLLDPPKLQKFIVSHFEKMWNRFFSEEWEKNKTMIEESVNAFQSVDLTNLDRLEAVKTVTGQRIEDDWQEWPWKLEWLKRAHRVVFIPSTHIGPYLVKSIVNNTFYICFNARLPEGSQAVASDLNRNEINVRMNALADDTRLRILKLLTETGEQSSQEIMNRLELSQSAASRHLKQLSATGFLTERRQTLAKVYDLNEEFIQKTLDAVSAFLRKKTELTSQ